MDREQKYEIIYEGRDHSGSVEAFVRRMNYFLKEIAILESIEEYLSNLIKNSVAEMNPRAERGPVWISRFNAKEKGQDAFYIHFNPTQNEQTEGIRYVQCVIAEGYFLGKEILFRPPSDIPPYVTREFIPFLRRFFEKLGFKVIG